MDNATEITEITEHHANNFGPIETTDTGSRPSSSTKKSGNNEKSKRRSKDPPHTGEEESGIPLQDLATAPKEDKQQVMGDTITESRDQNPDGETVTGGIVIKVDTEVKKSSVQCFVPTINDGRIKKTPIHEV